MGKAQLSIQNLQVEYHTDEEVIHAVNGISLDLEEGESLGLVGETGAGKTTLALSILGLLPKPNGRIVDGSIFFEGKELSKTSEEEMRQIRGNRISMIFQDPMTSLNPIFPVGEQIAEALEVHFSLTKEQAEKKTAELLELVGIPRNRMGEYPHQFSGGMKQRVVIAMALACNPKLLLADEPTTALDVTIQAQVLRMIRDLKRRMRTTLILISHDLGVVAQICNTVAIMYAGKIMEYGKIEDVFRNPLHPYTEGLFASIPRLDRTQRRLSSIPGLIPDPSNLPTGCVFHPRCPYRMGVCEKTVPPLVEWEGRKVHCLKYREG
ncbi:MAG: ABC transporter ATP-binding protein [Spirochaetes bacterium]|nr:ABC transporter ATP-binding protein [Spirochaetota bacterium]